MSKEIKFMKCVNTLAPGTEAFIVLKLGKDGQASLVSEGDMSQICFLNKVLDNFINDKLSGKGKHETPQ